MNEKQRKFVSAFFVLLGLLSIVGYFTIRKYAGETDVYFGGTFIRQASVYVKDDLKLYFGIISIGIGIFFYLGLDIKKHKKPVHSFSYCDRCGDGFSPIHHPPEDPLNPGPTAKSDTRIGGLKVVCRSCGRIYLCKPGDRPALIRDVKWYKYARTSKSWKIRK